MDKQHSNEAHAVPTTRDKGPGWSHIRQCLPGSDGLAKRRAEFADLLADLVTAVGAIDALDRQRLPADLRAAA